MKRLTVVILTVFCFISLRAQTTVGKPWIMDKDIMALRTNIAPGFNYNYGDYIQYAPGVLLYGVKACGYNTMSTWGRMLVSDAFSVAIMAGAVNGLKYSIDRTRPNGGHHSFPSGHSATAFMMAHWMHKEMGWRSGWWTAGGYALAVSTALQRILANRHYMSDTVAGALIGVGSVELGYFLSELIFKDRQIRDGYEPLHVHYDSNENKYYNFEIYYSRRFIVGNKDLKNEGLFPRRGSSVGLQAEIALMPRSGVMIRTAAGTLGTSCAEVPEELETKNLYNIQPGMYWEWCFSHWFEAELYTLIGYAHHDMGGGIDLTAGLSANIITTDHFRFKGFAEWETFSYNRSGKKFLNSEVLGFSAGIYW